MASLTREIVFYIFVIVIILFILVGIWLIVKAKVLGEGKRKVKRASRAVSTSYGAPFPFHLQE